MAVVTDFAANVDTILAGFYTTASQGMTGYVMPIAWMTFGIGILVWAYFVMSGQREANVTQGTLSSVFIIIVLAMAGGRYTQMVADPLFALPNQLTAAMSGPGVTPEATLDALSDKLLDLLSGIAMAMTDSAKNLNFGAALVLFFTLIVVGVVSALLLTGAIFIYLYGKIGLSLVLAVGPFFIIWLAWAPTRGIFWPWLNTALYLVFTYVLGVMFINLFIKIVDKYIVALMAAMGATDTGMIAGVLNGASGQLFNALGMAMQLTMIALPMFFLLLQIPTIAQSISSGSGGAFGNGMSSLYNTVRGGGGKGGGGGGGEGK